MITATNNHEKILNALGEPVFELDASGKVLFANALLQSWTGKSGNYIFAATLDKPHRKRFEQAFMRVIDGKTLSTHVELVIQKQNDRVAVDVSLQAIAGEGGSVAAVACWLRDLTITRAMEAAANVQGAHLFDLVENVSHACVIESETGTVEMVNGSFCDLFQLKVAAQSLIGTPCAGLFDRAAEQVEKKMAPVYFALDSAEITELEFPMKNGAIAIQQSRPVQGESAIAGRLHLFSLKTAQIQASEKTISATNAAQLRLVEKVAQELSQTVEGASRAIDRAELLELPDAIIERFRLVEQSATAAFESIANLVDLSRIDSEEIVLDKQKFSLRKSIAQMLENLMPNAAQRQVAVQVKVERDVADQLVGDGIHLLQALQYLLECGMPSTGGGSEVVLTVAPEYVTGSVTHLNFLIKHHFPLGRKRVALSASALMQLTMARQIIKSMGSKIDLQDTASGCEYQFTLALTWREPLRVANQPGYITLTGMPVLVVSSNPEERKSLTNLLRSWRMQPREADNGSMALDLLLRLEREKQVVPLLIISDQLAAQDSFLLAFRVKHHAVLANTVVMMLATKGKPGDAIACRENAISAYLRQPIVDYHLNEAIAMLMGVIDNGDTGNSLADTLITRHSLREHSAGNVLLIDGQREQNHIAARMLRRKDFRVVVVETAQEAYESLKQDIFNLIIVDAATPGFARNKAIPGLLRNHIQKNAETLPIILATSDDNAASRDYAGKVQRPYEKENFVNEVQRVAAL